MQFHAMQRARRYGHARHGPPTAAATEEAAKRQILVNPHPSSQLEAAKICPCLVAAAEESSGGSRASRTRSLSLYGTVLN